jgi:hypothetical protein
LAWAFDSVRGRLDQDDYGLATLAEELLHAAPGRARQVLLVVDQFEEPLTVAPTPARAQFARLLCPALDGSLRVVGTLRPEFLGQLLASHEPKELITRTSHFRRCGVKRWLPSSKDLPGWVTSTLTRSL